MDWNALRSHFPVTKDYVFVNHAAVAPIPLAAEEALREFARSAALRGSEAISQWAAKQNETRARTAAFLGSRPDEIAYVSATSQGLSIVANGVDWKAGDNVIIPDQEFPSNVYPWMNLQRLGVELRWWRSVDGRLDIDDLRPLIDGRTRVVSLSAVQWASGFRSDLSTISDMVHKRDILLCVDIIQSAGVMPLDVKSLGVDFAAADGHKWLLSVEGLGFFYCDQNALDRIHPANVGWKSVIDALEFDRIDFTFLPHAGRFETGSLNTAGIYALDASLDLLMSVGLQEIFERVLYLLDLFIEGLQTRGLKILSSLRDDERSGILIFSTGDRDRDVVAFLKERAVITSLRGGGIRVSPHFYNNEDDVARFLAVLDEAVKAVYA